MRDVELGLGGAGNILGAMQGFQTGGVGGYGQAGINLGALGTRALGAAGAITPGTAGEIAQGLGYAAVPLSVYNFARNWQSGGTWQDLMGGAATGASIGSAILPGVGTLIGAGLGAEIGAISSAFGPGKMDPENVNWNNYARAFSQNPSAVLGATPSQNYQALAGIFDARGSAIPFYNTFGRMGEGQFMTAMTDQVNRALQGGRVPVNATPAQIYSTVVAPWITQMGGQGGWQPTYTEQGAPEKGAIGALLTNLIGQWQSGMFNAASPMGIAGQNIPGLPVYGA
jgi:hypothetical protein